MKWTLLATQDDTGAHAVDREHLGKLTAQASVGTKAGAVAADYQPSLALFKGGCGLSYDLVAHLGEVEAAHNR